MYYKGLVITPRMGTICKCCGKRWWTKYNEENFICGRCKANTYGIAERRR